MLILCVHGPKVDSYLSYYEYSLEYTTSTLHYEYLVRVRACIASASRTGEDEVTDSVNVTSRRHAGARVCGGSPRR